MMILAYMPKGVTVLMNSDHIICVERRGTGHISLSFTDGTSITLDKGESERVWQLLLKKD